MAVVRGLKAGKQIRPAIVLGGRFPESRRTVGVRGEMPCWEVDRGRTKASYRDPLPRERTFDPKAGAERFERYVRHQLDTYQSLDPEMAKVTFAEWAQRWLPTVELSERAPSTISGYESAVRIQVLPFLGSRRLRTVRRFDMEEWLGELRAAGYATSTIHAARTVAGMVFASALDARFVASNPLKARERAGATAPLARRTSRLCRMT